MTWVPSNELDAQLSHLAWGWSLSLTLALLVGWRWTLAILISIALVKEFVLDLWVIEADTLAGSELDFFMYCVGFGIGLAVWWIVTIGIPSGNPPAALRAFLKRR